MTVYVGPTNWWWTSSPTASINCKVKAVLNTCGVGGALADGSRIMCASNGLAILVAPFCVEISTVWNNQGSGTKCCVCDWPSLCSRMISFGFNISDWFIPDGTQSQLGYQCRTRWDYYTNFMWTSQDSGIYGQTISSGNLFFDRPKSGSSGCFPTRPFRCVTY